MGGGTGEVDATTALVRDAIADLTGRQLTEEDLVRSFDELELDSLVLVDVICELEDHLGAELDDAMLQQMMDCASLSEMIRVYTSASAG